MNKFYLLTTILITSLFIIAQEDVEEVDPNIERVEKIQDLINRVEKNREELSAMDNARVNEFIKKVADRRFLLSKAKKQLADEEARNVRLEDLFEANEIKLSELETELNIKLGVLGELFGVARQMAGELQADSESAYNFTEYPNRTDALNEIGKIKVHNLKNLEDLWVLHLNEIASSGEIKVISANVINSSGDIEEDQLVRYGPFNMVKNRSFVKTDVANNAFSVLQKQPDRSLRRKFRSHYRSDGYAVAPIDPTRGFLLSLYLDKPSTFERIAQGKLIGFIIVLIGISGLIFAAYRYYTLYLYSKTIKSKDENDIFSKIENISNASKDVETFERECDEVLLTVNGNLSWGVNWIKFLAAVAPLLGLLGTVIGMIETFQAITVFGTGDPKQMAGGISQALVTTMLGLIFAAPLLAMYTLLSEKVSEILQEIEEFVAITIVKKVK
ncbi:MAG: MotA/TolQ/ExbB proton channel family protein [SAR86 cluster bacterium]|uniref:MotA/TolQ/ExbB proton channel family protein n=1 Tax=SAR86 cluster bacterium TaxID=2030880 RepID=A0A520N5R7_9GAMM|nr:MAG: MotA/TolQ/ExbB proton channel family protein [SAR86 cluster bacterium]